MTAGRLAASSIATAFPPELYEYEYDHVFMGNYQGNVFPNQDEIMEVRWFETDELLTLMQEKPRHVCLLVHHRPALWFSKYAAPVTKKRPPVSKAETGGRSGHLPKLRNHCKIV